MNSPRVPHIFSAARTFARRKRMLSRAQEDRARFLADDAIDDVIERVGFVRHQPGSSLVIGDPTSQLAKHLTELGSRTVEADILDYADHASFDLEAPYPDAGFDFIAVLGLLDAINDLPGALIHIRNALSPSGLAIASFVGGQSLPKLRSAMLAADGSRPAARIHPMVDSRAAPQLLQRAGWKDPVVDTHVLTVRYSSLEQLVHDLRDQGLNSVLDDAGPALGKAALEKARAAFLSQADEDGKVSERFEVITLTGRK